MGNYVPNMNAFWYVVAEIYLFDVIFARVCSHVDDFKTRNKC